MGFLKKLYKDEAGQGLVEYALIIALVAVALIGSLIILKDEIKDIFENIDFSEPASEATSET